MLDDLGEQIPEIAGGTGTVVLHSKDGFTPAQRDGDRRDAGDCGAPPARHRHGRPVRDPGRSSTRSAADLARRSRSSWSTAARKYEKGAHQLAQLRWLIGEGERDIARLQRTDPDNATLPARIDGQAELETTLADGRAHGSTDARDAARGRASRSTPTAPPCAASATASDWSARTARRRWSRCASTPACRRSRPTTWRWCPRRASSSPTPASTSTTARSWSSPPRSVASARSIGIAVAAVVLLVMLGSFVMAGTAARDRLHRRRCQPDRRHGADPLARPPADGPRARRHARPRGRHRLRPVHRQPAPAPARRRRPRRCARSTREEIRHSIGLADRHGRHRRRGGRRHRRHRARGAARLRHPGPGPDGCPRRGHRAGHGARGPHPDPGPALAWPVAAPYPATQ